METNPLAVNLKLCLKVSFVFLCDIKLERVKSSTPPYLLAFVPQHKVVLLYFPGLLQLDAQGSTLTR